MDLASRTSPRALERFRPERQRQDGIEHLVFFPMYKQNGSRDTCYEALIVRVPWPDWIAELERTRYDNPKFVPVELIDGTRGYDSECAVLFPETVSVAGRPVNNFGAIFCDREAERLRRVAGAAVDLLRLNLPPDAARLLRSPGILQQAYILWDLIHDRAHSHGDPPVRPVHDPPARPLLDVLAGGAAQELYRTGIDRTKLQHWAAAHDLVAANVSPAIGSQWADTVREFKDVEDPRPYIDLVLEDEFPLSLFYSSLKAKLAA